MKKLVKYQSVQTQPTLQEKPKLNRIFSSKSCTLTVNKQSVHKLNQRGLFTINKLSGQGISHRIKNGQFFKKCPQTNLQTIAKTKPTFFAEARQQNNKKLFLNPKLCAQYEPIVKSKSNFLKKQTTIQKSILMGLFKKRLSQQYLPKKKQNKMRSPQKQQIEEYMKIFGRQSPSKKTYNLIGLMSRYYQQHQQNICAGSKQKLYENENQQQYFHQLKAKKNW